MLLASYGCIGDEAIGNRYTIFSFGLAGIALLAYAGLQSREYLEIANDVMRRVDYKSTVVIPIKDITYVNWVRPHHVH